MFDEVPDETTDETTIHSTQSFIDEVPDETTIHSTQSFNTIIQHNHLLVKRLVNTNEPKIKRMIKGNKLFYYHH